MPRRKIVIVGGGSYSWTPHVVKDIILKESLQDSEFVLYDINKEASDLTKAFLDKLAGQLGIKAKIISTDDRAKAFRNAQYFVITISTGGFDAMAHDLAIPEEYGIYHTIGDTSGPGGWARSIRNFEPFMVLCEAINRYAPGAMVLNYTNPMTTLTDVLSRLCDGPVLGLCHGLFENLRFLKDFYKLKSEDDISIRYGGLNHFFWIIQGKAGKVDIIADLNRRLKRQGFTDMLTKIHADEMGFKSNREVATELARLTGLMPYLGDRHTCEFFPWYITNKKNMRKYKIVRTTVATRRQAHRNRWRKLKQMVRGKISDPVYLRASRETAADIIEAHAHGNVFIDVGNVPNVGQISNLPLGAILETDVRVDRNGFAPITMGDLPEPAVNFCQLYTEVFTMTVDACLNKDKQLALQALRLDPVCSHLNTEQVNEMGERLLRAHKRFIKVF